ncbi:hypothetical protein [Sedimentitalea todarodis]|uniref:Transposase DDE domain-containing protein n=1 Tax=Sedimentitalea todarodis TaxID=1631240 RepID=A0ABU3VH70_9RHOB|nr:hypothetical protein [Sedimentitalea todarodis]MDU9005335.1 hypothetical protein [Sedimentitalea todarodis]
MRRYWTTACLSCPVKSRCTTGRERRISPSRQIALQSPAGQWVGTRASGRRDA